MRDLLSVVRILLPGKPGNVLHNVLLLFYGSLLGLSEHEYLRSKCAGVIVWWLYWEYLRSRPGKKRVCEMHFAVKEADRYQTMTNIFISSLDTCDFLFSIHIHIYCSIHKRNFKEFWRKFWSLWMKTGEKMHFSYIFLYFQYKMLTSLSSQLWKM